MARPSAFLRKGRKVEERSPLEVRGLRGPLKVNGSLDRVALSQRAASEDGHLIRLGRMHAA